MGKHDSLGQFKNLVGYKYVSNWRIVHTGGGVGMYIKEGLLANIRTDPTVMEKKVYIYLYMLTFLLKIKW